MGFSYITVTCYMCGCCVYTYASTIHVNGWSHSISCTSVQNYKRKHTCIRAHLRTYALINTQNTQVHADVRTHKHTVTEAKSSPSRRALGTGMRDSGDPLSKRGGVANNGWAVAVLRLIGERCGSDGLVLVRYFSDQCHRQLMPHLL